MGPMHRGEMASERLLSQKERNIARGTDEMGPQREGLVRTGKGCDRLKGTHLRRPQREDMSAHGKKRPHKGPSRAGQQSEGGHAKCPGVGIL